MICLRCNGENEDNSVMCAHCGADMHINIRTRAIAVRLYNKGLSLAKERKLSEALEAMRKSIYFDRFDVNARNVLGLIYFELGMIADALKQWAISAAYMGDNNLSKVYLSRIKENVREMEKMNDAVKMYNQGLINIKNKNDDMAIIQLKKAIELNPKLIEAKNLLALLYASSNRSANNAQAIQLVDSVRAYDLSNSKALSLKDSLGQTVIPAATRYKQLQQTKNEQMAKQNEAYVIQKKVNRFDKFPIGEILSLVVGAVCAAAVMYFLVVPSIEASGKEELDKALASVAEMQLSHEEVLAQKEAEIEELKNRNDELALANEETANRTALLEKQQKIMTAVSLNAAGSIKEAAALLKDLDTEGLTDVEMSQYNSIKETVFPQMASALFTEGRSAYNARQYDAAKEALLSGLEYNMTESNAGDAYYFLGRIAENNGDIEGARQNYEKTVNEYRNCTQYTNASNRLRALG